MTAGFEVDIGAQLVAGVNGLSAKIGGLCDRLDSQARFVRRANEAFRKYSFPINVNSQLSSGAATVNMTSHGPGAGYMWGIRRFTCQGFTAGTVTFYLDNTNGESVMPFPAAAVNTIGKGELVMKPMQRLAYTATGITGTPIAWVDVDVFEEWLLPWYIGAQRDGA